MFTDDMKVVIAVTTAAGAGAQTLITSGAVDCLGFSGCCFLVQLGPITGGAETSVKVQQSSDDGDSDAYSDVEGSAITVADDDDNKLKYVDVVNPGKRYLKLLVSRGTQDATVGGVLAVLYKSKTFPITQGTNVAGEQHTRPAEGTA
jgi:hypothetical protein